MSRIVKLGAPSLTGKDCNDLVAETFADAKYPLNVLVQNHMPRDVVFPDAPGFLAAALKLCSSATTTKASSWRSVKRVSGIGGLSSSA